MAASDEGRKKFPDFVPPTKINYKGDAPTLRIRQCSLTVDGVDYTFDKEEVRIGAMEDNDVVIRDETTSRYHCKIVQEDSGYVLVDLHSTNGTFVNRVRVREAFLTPGCVVGTGTSEFKFNAKDEQVEIVPSEKEQCGDLIGGNAAMRQIYTIIEKIAPTATTVVIEGETGTGKEVVAQSIHKLSERGKGPMVVFDCGAVPPNLIESELFGHEKGSFTGAVMTRQGLFEMADGGTVFLDELGELPIDLQPKLLRALEQREVRRVGSAKAIKVDVRIIAATNRDLEEEVHAGRFRQDLFYRLSVVRLLLPPLRNRTDDVPLLVNRFLQNGHYNKAKDGTLRVSGVSPEAMSHMTSYNWPGNVRELVNVVERAVSFSESNTITPADLPEHIRTGVGGPGAGLRNSPAEKAAKHDAFLARAGTPPRPPAELVSGDVTFKDAKEKWVSSFERDYIISLLKRHGGNISHAAREADIDRKYFRKLMKKYDIDASVADEV